MSEFLINFFNHRSKKDVSRNGKYKRDQLTQSPTFHFFGRDRKDVYYLDHNFDDHARHSCSRCEASIYVKSLKETSDAVEDISEHVLTCAGIFSRLDALSVKIDRPGNHKNTDR